MKSTGTNSSWSSETSSTPCWNACTATPSFRQRRTTWLSPGERINDLDEDELAFSRAAALLGIDPFDVPEHVADAVVAFCEHTDPSIRDDALALANGGLLAPVRDWLNDATVALAQEQQDDSWSDIRQMLPGPRLRLNRGPGATRWRAPPAPGSPPTAGQSTSPSLDRWRFPSATPIRRPCVFTDSSEGIPPPA